MRNKAFLAVVFLVVAGLVLPARGRMSPRQIYKTKAAGVVLIVAAPEGAASASAGTGSIIAADGTIITNSHVILDPASHKPFGAIHVFLKPRRVTGDMNKDLSRHYQASVIAFDENLDLALLRLKNPPSGLTVLTLGNPDELGPGDETVAIGHPEQGGLWTITTGVIGTEFENFKGVPGKHVFQMETSLNRGNSGGPLFDVRGYQIGVNTAIARKGQGGVAITGVNFAVKASVVKKYAAAHGVRLAYGPERLSEEPVRVADAAAGAAAGQQPRQVKDTAAAGASPVDATEGRRVYGSKETTGGTITVEDDASGETATGADDEGEQLTPARQPARVVRRRPVRNRRPVRFSSRYRVRPRPYSFRRLLTAVDKVRGRAQEAFDDLDNEIERWQRRHR